MSHEERTDGVELIHVVVPAHDEAALLPATLRSLASAIEHLRRSLPSVTARLTIVLDACTDASAAVCVEHGVDVIEVLERNVGAARARGVDRARDLAAVDGVAPGETWIAHTDADTSVPFDWLTDQVEVAEAGADVVLGRVEPDGTATSAVLARWHLLHPPGQVGVHGANLGVRLASYDAVGGMAPLREREDLDLYQRLLASGARYGAATRPVTTSSRLDGRTRGGFAGYLADLTVELTAELTADLARASAVGGLTPGRRGSPARMDQPRSRPDYGRADVGPWHDARFRTGVTSGPLSVRSPIIDSSAVRAPVRSVRDLVVDARRLRVASVPSEHVYVRHLAPEEGGGAVRLADPRPTRDDGTSGQWWPPVMLDPEWVEQHADDIDVLHLHFGFDAQDPEDLRTWVRTLERRRVPFVLTVHDLRNPHHVDRSAHDAHLEVLVPAADALITLTEGAAAEIRQRWGRDALVLPHPHVVPLEQIARVRAERRADRDRADRPFRVGVHLKSLRACMAAEPVVRTLVEAVADLTGAVLQVNIHRDVLESDGLRHDPDLSAMLLDEASRGGLDLRVHDFLSDAALFDYLATLDVSVLPYRFGTHSGWLEACRDLGTTVVAPTCGYYTDQGPVLTYRHDEQVFGAQTLVDAVRRAHRHRPDLGATLEERRSQRARLADAHEDLYRRLHAAAGRA